MSTLIQIPGITYMPHQNAAIHWMIEREDEPYEFIDADNTAYIYGGILADEMGLGKTISVIGLMLNNPVPYTLVVAPLAVLGQWAEIANKAGFNVFKQSGPFWDTVSTHSSSKNGIYLVNYERINVNPTATHERNWDRIIMDEAHKARNHRTAIFNQLITIRATTRWALTGTPIVNKKNDLVSIYRLIGADIEVLAKNTLTMSHINHLMMARTRSMLPEGTMPTDPVVKHYSLDFDSAEEEMFYVGVQGAIIEKWKTSKYNLDTNHSMEQLVLLLRLRQLSVHPQVYIDSQKAARILIPDWEHSCTKFEHVKKMLAEFPINDGTVVFCSFRREIDMFQKDLTKSGMKVYTYYGGMTEEQRATQIRGAKTSLEAGMRTVMLVQINSGGTGLNLQFMNRCIFMSPWWNAALMDQAVGRIVRFGQTKKTYVYHIQLKQEEGDSVMNIDKFMFRKTIVKRQLCEIVLQQARIDLE